MKKRAFRLGAACVLASVAISAAHAVSNTKTIRLATFDEPFNDPDDATAKQLSKTEGLTVAEASRRLRIMGELGRLAPALSARFPKGFAGAEATTGSDFRVAIYGVAADLEAIGNAARQFAGKGELASVLDVRTAPVSESEIGAQARGYLSSLGSNATIATNARTGQIKLLVKDPTSALAAIVGGRFRAAPGIDLSPSDWSILCEKFPVRFGRYWTRESAHEEVEVQRAADSVHPEAGRGWNDRGGGMPKGRHIDPDLLPMA